jgi:hypothetical protein
MRLISAPLSGPHRDAYLYCWFRDDNSDDVKVSALLYLADFGVPEDLQIIRRELDRNQYPTKTVAMNAIIRINLRQSREKAIAALYELQPTFINKVLLSALFDNGSSLTKDILSQGIRHVNSDVRRVTTRLLRKRGELSDEMAAQLTNDSDAAVRYEALNSLIDSGRQFSEAEAKEILVKASETDALRGISPAGSSDVRFDSAGEGCWKQYEEERLRTLPDEELERRARDNPIFDRAGRFILAARRFPQYGDSLRNAIDDQFREEFAKALNHLSKKLGPHVDASELLEKIQSLETIIRRDLTRKALDLLCRKADPTDLTRVRDVVNVGFVGYSVAAIEYLNRFGEWDDIPLVIAATERQDFGSSNSLLSSFRDDIAKYQTAARVIYRIGRTRLSELLFLPMPSKLLALLVVKASDREFRALTAHSIIELLMSEDANVRKAVAIRAVQALTKERINNIISNYVSLGTYYYNVIHWLDFGASAPRGQAILSAKKILREWQ